MPSHVVYEAYYAPNPETEKTLIEMVPTIQNVISPKQEELPKPPQEVELPPRIDDRIRTVAKKYNIAENLALKIAKCESDLNPRAKNPRSTAGGIYQFIDSTWEKTINDMGLPKTSSKFDPETNIEAGIWLMKNSGLHHWKESAPCWGKNI